MKGGEPWHSDRKASDQPCEVKNSTTNVRLFKCARDVATLYVKSQTVPMIHQYSSVLIVEVLTPIITVVRSRHMTCRSIQFSRGFLLAIKLIASAVVCTCSEMIPTVL